MRQHLPDLNYFIGKTIPELPDYKIVELIGSGNNAHVFKAYSENANNYIACKIIPKENLIGKDFDKPVWREEIDKANILRTRIVVKFWKVTQWIVTEYNIDCVVLCSEYVNGKNLEEYIKKNKNNIAILFAEHFLKTMLEFVNDMEQHNVQHGDLHSKNILVEDRSDQLGDSDFEFRVTDFGVASVTSDANFKDDFEQTALVLRQLLENINYQSSTPRNKYAFNILNDHFLARFLVEKDLTREPNARQTRKLYEILKQIDNDFSKEQRKSTQVDLTTPFDFLSCEQIGESHNLLKALYSDHFLGLQEIESRNNLVLTGPRGCGKSTVFKTLSLYHRTLVNDDKPDDVKYIGVYYRCDDMYAVFPRYKLPDSEEAYDIPIHYITNALIYETLESIEKWGVKYFQSEFLKCEAKVSSIIWDIFGIEPPHEPGANSFKALGFWLQKERHRCVEKQRFIHDPKQKIGYYFGPSILVQVCEALTQNISFLNGRLFYFFIDDYSMPKITGDLQKNINRLLMQRTASCFFKISTESPVSYIRSDIDGKSYVEGREFNLLNLGLVYLNANRKDMLKFFEDVFARRFKAISHYPVSTLQELIGSYNMPSQNKIALSIRADEKPDMWGKEVLVQLCSGDIFYIISLVKRMVSNVGGTTGLNEKAIPKVPKGLQKKAIREEAGYFLTNLRGIQNGEHLVEIVTAFGNVASSWLKHKNSKNEQSNPPHQASRIEPYEELELSGESQKYYDELLRYSLFIEDPRGKSRRGKIVPRLYLRRALLPQFNLTFSKRDSIGLEIKDIEMLLLKPKEFEKKHRLKKELREKVKTENKQVEMFKDK